MTSSSLAVSLSGISFILDVFISHTLLKSILFWVATHQSSLLQSIYYLLLCHCVQVNCMKITITLLYHLFNNNNDNFIYIALKSNNCVENNLTLYNPALKCVTMTFH